MSDSLFTLKMVTPVQTTEKRIKAIRLKDGSGFFGVMKGHIDFVTALEPSLCYSLDNRDREVFFAVDGGMLRVRGGMATLTSREIIESDDAEKLSEIIENTIMKRDASEVSFLNMIKGIERTFMEKTLDFIRQGK